MAETNHSSGLNERTNKEAPQLVALLKEMKNVLDKVTDRVQALTSKVKANQLPTADGISYLEAKYLLLLNYCQSLVYIVLCKAKGLSIEGHPVVRSLLEIQMFLKKIRPIDKKLQHQIDRLTMIRESVNEKADLSEKKEDETENTDDLLKYRPNPDLLISKTNPVSEDGVDVYRPPKFAPMLMEDDEKISKLERKKLRKDKETLRKSRQSAYMREIMDDFQGRPEEVRETFGAESTEMTSYMEKMEQRARQEEDLFTRAPLTKMEKKKMKHMKKSRNGLLGLTESFYDEIKTLPFEENDGAPQTSDFGSGGDRKLKKRKRKY